MLALLAMDWEEMVVHPWVAAFAACFGLAAAAIDPTLSDPAAATPAEGALWSLVGAVSGYLLFRLVALGGRLLFGRRSRRFESPEKWHLHQVGEDIVLTLAGKDYPWAEFFPENGCRIQLQDATLAHDTAAADAPAGSITLLEDALILPDSHRLDLANYESLSGDCRGITTYREAMGSGDAWLAMAIGALCGWQGVIFALVGGSFIGLLYAALMRIRRGVPMPFGPALILAAYLWLFWGPQLLDLYLELVR